MHKVLAIVVAFAAATLGLVAAAPTQAATLLTTKVSVAAKPNIVHTGTLTDFTGAALYAKGSTWAPVYKGTVTLQYQLKGDTAWHGLTSVAGKTSTTGAYRIAIKWPLKTSARVRAKLAQTTQIKPAWSSTVWVTRVAADVQIGVKPGAFCSPNLAKGITWAAAWMTCKAIASDPYKRWRAA